MRWEDIDRDGMLMGVRVVGVIGGVPDRMWNIVEVVVICV